MHESAYQNNPIAMDILLRHGADPNARDAAGLTPLGVARKYRRSMALEWLRRHGGTE